MQSGRRRVCLALQDSKYEDDPVVQAFTRALQVEKNKVGGAGGQLLQATDRGLVTSTQGWGRCRRSRHTQALPLLSAVQDVRLAILGSLPLANDTMKEVLSLSRDGTAEVTAAAGVAAAASVAGPGRQQQCLHDVLQRSRRGPRAQAGPGPRAGARRSVWPAAGPVL
jgi:hypothetical protein